MNDNNKKPTPKVVSLKDYDSKHIEKIKMLEAIMQSVMYENEENQ